MSDVHANHDAEVGLTSEEARARLQRYGENTIAEKRVNPLLKLLSYFWGPIPWMIEIAAVLSGAVRHWEDFTIIVIMLVLNASVGFWQEFKADNAIAALKRRLALTARVLRDGHWQTIPGRELVPGDVIFIKLGNIVPADAKLTRGDYLSVDQSALTGESLPVEMNPGDTVRSGSIVRQGEMHAVVTATGMQTWFGRTAALVEGAGKRSHFQGAVLNIGNFLIFTTLGLVAVIVVVALFRHDPMLDVMLFALILTVAAIPVALPAVLSVTMAVGAARLAKLQAIVSRLVSIEEMAGMTVLCCDKTGTLTKNELTLGEPVVIGDGDVAALLIAAALTCERDAPDPIDAAILAGIAPEQLAAADAVVELTPFDPVSKRAQAIVRAGVLTYRISKGAPQVIARLCRLDEATAAQVNDAVAAFASHGYRALGVARSDTGDDWRFLGLLPLFDPPRDDSLETVRAIGAMGLRLKMVTGDHEAIAREIGGRLGLRGRVVTAGDMFDDSGRLEQACLDEADSFAEVFPEHKYRIVRALQDEGFIVGMTGDGVNDAPALKQADVGIAVSGATDAARAAADLVLTAPGLSVIACAVEESRRIFARMSNYATYRIAETIRVLVFMTLSILIFNFYPVTAVMIVLLAILNDFPIMAIAWDNVRVSPLPLAWNMRRVLTLSVVLGLLGVASSFTLFWIAEHYLALARPVTQTVIFLKLLVAGHMTIYLTRNPGWFWQRPWPNWRLLVASEATQMIGTLAAVYGWFVEPIGWPLALAVWGYALVWFCVNNAAQVLTDRSFEEGSRRHERHLQRVHARLH